MTTSSGQVAGAAQQAAGQTATTAKDEAAQVGQVAASAASDVAGTAKQQAGQVAGEAVNQLRSLTDDARTQASQQASNATDKLSVAVRSLAGELRDLGQGKGDASSTVAGLVQQLADKGEQLADYVAAQGPGGLVSELRSFASRKPGTFLLGALAAGVLTGRTVKGATSGGDSTSVGTSGSGGATYTSDLTLPPVAPAPPVTSAPSVTTESSTYLGSVPVVHSDDSGMLDSDVNTIGPVSGDERLKAEGLETTTYEQGTGLR